MKQRKKFKLSRKKILVGVRKYKLETSEKVFCGNGNTPSFGGCSFNRGVIGIKEGDRELMMGTLFHEMLEAINFQNGLKLKHVVLSVIAEQMYNALEVNKFLK